MKTMERESFFQDVARAPEVAVYAMMAAFREDPSPVKLNLGIGVYRTEEGKPHLLNVVRKAEERLSNDMSLSKEYLPLMGLPEFDILSAKILLGADSPAIKEKRIITMQCLSGSGSLRMGAELLTNHHHLHTVYISEPTYGNHPNFFLAAGFDIKTYRYYDPTTRGLDLKGLLEDLGSAPQGATVLLQLCGHNPTGVDPDLHQWEQIRKLIRSKGLLPFFDCAYQGFVSGDLDVDAQPIRMFMADNGECLAAQSFSKTMGLYGERVGALSVVCQTADVAQKLDAHMNMLPRAMYLSPPLHGASIVLAILKDSELFKEWHMELKLMSERVASARRQLFNALRARGTPGDWSHIARQVGMFSITGLNAEQIALLINEYHVYLQADGRINMAAICPMSLEYLADAIHATVARLV